MTHGNRVGAAAVHAFTASGAAFGVLALVAIADAQPQRAVLWMAICLVIDMVDGTLARWFGVKGALPELDGALLDNVVDYFTYVIVSAFFLYELGGLTEPAAVLAVALMCMSSAYQFSRVDAKTADHYFKGFPSYWNLVVVYFWLLGATPQSVLVVVGICSALCFVPLEFIYPSRTRRHRTTTFIVTAVGGLSLAYACWQHPAPAPGAIATSLVCVAVYIGMSGWHQFGPRPNGRG